jgi:hypothetical protein
MWLAVSPAGGTSSFAAWYCWVGKLTVNVMFAQDGEKRVGLLGGWHPRYRTNKLATADFDFRAASAADRQGAPAHAPRRPRASLSKPLLDEQPQGAAPMPALGVGPPSRASIASMRQENR